MTTKQNYQKPSDLVAKLSGDSNNAPVESGDDSNQQNFNKQQSNNLFNKVALYSGIGVLALGSVFGINKYIEHAHKTSNQMPKVIGGPDGYKVVDFDIPTQGEVKEIYLVNVLKNLKPTTSGDTITFSGAMEYRLKSAKFEDPTDLKGIKNAREAVRDGSVSFVPVYK